MLPVFKVPFAILYPYLLNSIPTLPFVKGAGAPFEIKKQVFRV